MAKKKTDPGTRLINTNKAARKIAAGRTKKGFSVASSSANSVSGKKRSGGYNEKPIYQKNNRLATGTGAAYGFYDKAIFDTKKKIPLKSAAHNTIHAMAAEVRKNPGKYGKRNYNNYTNGNTYGNLGMSGTTGASVYSGDNYLDYLKYLADQNTAVNIEMNERNNAFSADQAKLQRDWETQMSNTAHQREVKDLQAAGLNPILSANAGAAVPTGAAAGASNFAGADTSAVNALAGVLESTIHANASITAASMNAASNMYGAAQSAEAMRYSADQSLKGTQYSTKVSSQYGLVGDIIRLAGTIFGGFAAGRGLKGKLKTEYVNAPRYPGKYAHT